MTYVQGVSVFASAHSLVTITVDRLHGMYRGIGANRTISGKTALTIILAIWAFGLVLMIPCLLVFDVKYLSKDGISQCVETWPSADHGKYFYLICNLICCYALPLIIIVIANLLIWSKVARREMTHLPSSAITGITIMHLKTRANVQRSLSAVTFAFLICWLPLYTIVSRIELFSDIPLSNLENSLLHVAIPIAQLLGSMNSSINPIIYAFLNQKFRRALIIFCHSIRETSSTDEFV